MLRRLQPLVLPLALLVAGCELTPSFVTGADIDDAYARQQYKTVCKGVEMADEDVRRYAASRLEEIDEQLAVDCVCSATTRSADDGTLSWDSAVLSGLTGSDRDEMVQCFVALFDKPGLEDRPGLVRALAQTRGASARARFTALAKADADVETRKAALEALTGSREEAHVALFLQILEKEDDGTLQAAAVAAMAGNASAPVLVALEDSAKNGASGTLRSAALLALKRSASETADPLICDAMMNDSDAGVRAAAIGAYRGTKRASAVACLRKRAFEKEYEASVRETLLRVLKSSPTDEARDVLCDAIPFFLRTYVIEDVPDKIPGTNIVEAQNDVDWDRSYECLQKAVRSSRGYSCYAKQHVGAWFREVGGSTYVPRCPKDKVTSAGGVVNFD
jgi:hypothetical protein